MKPYKVELWHNNVKRKAYYDTGTDMSIIPEEWLDEPPKESTVVTLANGDITLMPIGKFKGERVGVGPNPLISPNNSEWIIPQEHTCWMKEVNVQTTIEELVEKSELKDKDRLRALLETSQVAKFKNDVGLMKTEPYVIKGGMPGKQRQYPLGEAEQQFIEIIEELVKTGVVE